VIHYGPQSRRVRSQLHPQLQRLVDEYADCAPDTMDLSLVCGFRNEATQNAMFARGTSKRRWPLGKHNRQPSEAFDFVPYPFDTHTWEDSLRFARIAGAFFIVAHRIAVPIRWGGDWDADGRSLGERFLDLGHIELVTS
jgi:peptidoglycan L-alanyl-D-glutamate endopeptidase CwlK